MHTAREASWFKCPMVGSHFGPAEGSIERCSPEKCLSARRLRLGARAALAALRQCKITPLSEHVRLHHSLAYQPWGAYPWGTSPYAPWAGAGPAGACCSAFIT